MYEQLYLKKNIGNFELLKPEYSGKIKYIGDLDDDGSLTAEFLIGENGFFLRFEVSYYGGNYSEYYHSPSHYRESLMELFLHIEGCQKDDEKGLAMAIKNNAKQLQAVEKMLVLFEAEYERLNADYYHIDTSFNKAI